MFSNSLFCALTLAAALAAGCVNEVGDRCPSCTVIHWSEPRVPSFRPTTRAVVVLVPGFFGFGDEWNEVVKALQGRGDLEFVVFWYKGIARGPSRIGDSLALLLDGIERSAPPSVSEVVLIGHSFGGLLATYAAHFVSPPLGRRLAVHAIDPPRGMSVLAQRPERVVNTPLGVAVGEVETSTPPVPPRVDITEYFTGEEESRSPPPGVKWRWLGSGVTHDGSVPLVSLPVVRAIGK